jgi:cell division septation protein DedD
MEKRQALILLVLVLAVSLVSFTLGVMVGRSGSPGSVVAGSAPSPARLPVGIKDAPPASASAGAATERPAEGLTFYDTLPKGEQPPLGSGINLPPREKAAVKVTASAPASPAAVTANLPKAEAQAVSAGGGYAVQVASFRQADDALALQKRLAGKNYAAFTEEADLKEKGIWHRVCVGPFASAEAAAGIVEKLQAEEKLAALVKKR